MLPAMEAVQAAKSQSLVASEELDRALRRAFFGESRCISLRHVILEVASGCDGVDLARLTEDLDAAAGRGRVFDDWRMARGGAVRGSAHLFLSDGTNEQNPGISIGWRDDGTPGGRSWIEADDRSLIEGFVRRAAAETQTGAITSRQQPGRRSITCTCRPSRRSSMPTRRSCTASSWGSSGQPRRRTACRRPSCPRCAPTPAFVTPRTCAPGSTPSPSGRRPTWYAAAPGVPPATWRGVDPAAPAAPDPSDDGIWHSVRRLPVKQRDAIVHRFVLDLAYAEISDRMGISEEAARQNVSAGLRRLRREVTP